MIPGMTIHWLAEAGDSWPQLSLAIASAMGMEEIHVLQAVSQVMESSSVQPSCRSWTFDRAPVLQGPLRFTDLCVLQSTPREFLRTNDCSILREPWDERHYVYSWKRPSGFEVPLSTKMQMALSEPRNDINEQSRTIVRCSVIIKNYMYFGEATPFPPCSRAHLGRYQAIHHDRQARDLDKGSPEFCQQKVHGRLWNSEGEKIGRR
jgi:hypothetical protein